MFEHTPNDGGGLFKFVATLILVTTIGLLSIAARKSPAARKLHSWFGNARNPVTQSSGSVLLSCSSFSAALPLSMNYATN
jgi:hypothetical protein